MFVVDEFRRVDDLDQVAVTSRWAVIGAVGIEQEDACLDVDLSVDIGVTLGVDAFLPSPADPDGRVDLNLRLASDASDWDAFRCWASTAGVGGPALLAWIAEQIKLDVGIALKGTAVGDGFTKIDSDDSSVTYSRSLRLPAFPVGSVLGATVGADGLVVNGTSFFFPAEHAVTFAPSGGIQPSTWSGEFHCSGGWQSSYAVAPVG